MYDEFIRLELETIQQGWEAFLGGLTPEQQEAFQLCLDETDRAEAHIRDLAESSGHSSVRITSNGGAICHVQVVRSVPNEVKDDILRNYAQTLEAVGCLKETHTIAPDFRKVAKVLKDDGIEPAIRDELENVMAIHEANIKSRANTLHISGVASYIGDKYFRGMVRSATEGGYNMVGVLDFIIDEVTRIKEKTIAMQEEVSE